MPRNQSQSSEIFIEKAHAIEERKETVRQERERKKQAKLNQKKRAIQEKLLAPILLVFTIVLSLIIIFFK